MTSIETKIKGLTRKLQNVRVSTNNNTNSEAPCIFNNHQMPSSPSLVLHRGCTLKDNKVVNRVDSNKHAQVIETLMTDMIPQMFRRGNVLFQNAYKRFNNHVLKSTASMNHYSNIQGHSPNQVYEDNSDEVEFQFIPGEIMDEEVSIITTTTASTETSGGSLYHAKLKKATLVWDSNDVICNDESLSYPNNNVDDASSIATGVGSIFIDASTYSTYNSSSATTPKVDKLLAGVVMVALWDKSRSCIVRAGSGFVADDKRGLVITANHILFNLEELNPNDGRTVNGKFIGLPNTTAIIGMHQGRNKSAVFMYCADIVASGMQNVDACVLQIRTKFQQPIELDDHNHLTERPVLPIALPQLKNEMLKRLIMTGTKPPTGDQVVMVIGFPQTNEGFFIGRDERINQIVCVNKGYVCKTMYNSSPKSEHNFVSKSEIVVRGSCNGCYNSGGPCVNELGEVIGILSRIDPVDAERHYLTPASELKVLLNQANENCEDSIYLNSYCAMEQF